MQAIVVAEKQFIAVTVFVIVAKQSSIVDGLTIVSMWVHISLVLAKLQQLSMSMLEPRLMDLLQQLSATVKQSAIVEQFVTVEQFVAAEQSTIVDMLITGKPMWVHISLVLVKLQRLSMRMLEPSSLLQ